jgi:sortase A
MSTPTLVPPDVLALQTLTAPTPPPAKRRRAAGPPLPLWRIITSVIAGTISLLMLWSVAYLSVISGLQHDRSQHELYGTFRNELALGVLPSGGMISPGQAVASLQIPNAGISSEVVVEGTTSGNLRMGPGHLPTSPMPGQLGVSVIYGRSLAFGAPFASLTRLRPGEPITVITGEGAFHYDVLDQRQAGDVIPAALSQVPSALTLVTRAGGWSSGHIVYVDALLKDKPVGAPPGRPNTLAPGEGLNQGQSDQVTLVQLVLWLQLIVIVACGLAWIQTKWSRWQIWLVGTPILLGALWGLSNTAVVLLPNLL